MVKYEELGKGIVKRSEKKRLGLFIDGTGLDRATRRINKKVDMSSLVRGVTSGIQPIVARYYTLLPYEDDSRQRAFLDAVSRANLQVIVKRLPPKGITRQVSIDSEMASDIVAFALGHFEFSDLSEYKPESSSGKSINTTGPMPFGKGGSHRPLTPTSPKEPSSPSNGAQKSAEPPANNERRSIVVICPSRDISYSISLAREFGVETTTADFGQFNSGDILKSAAKWIDLSDSETIWRDQA